MGAEQPVGLRSQPRVDWFLSPLERLNVGMIGSEAGRDFRALGDGAVAGDHNLHVPGGLSSWSSAVL